MGLADSGALIDIGTGTGTCSRHHPRGRRIREGGRRIREDGRRIRKCWHCQDWGSVPNTG